MFDQRYDPAVECIMLCSLAPRAALGCMTSRAGNCESRYVVEVVSDAFAVVSDGRDVGRETLAFLYVYDTSQVRQLWSW